MMLPVFSENIGRPSQSRQRCVMVLCLIFDWTLKLPHFGQCGPCDHICFSNQRRAASSFGNIRMSLTKLIPSRSLLPGAVWALQDIPRLRSGDYNIAVAARSIKCYL